MWTPGWWRPFGSVIRSPSTVDLLYPSATLPAGVLPAVHQGSRLTPGASILQKGAVGPAPPVSWFLQPSLPRPEGFGVVASHHRTVDPERLRHLVSLPHENSTVSPSLHPSRRLDVLPGPAGRLPTGSCSSRFASLPSIGGARTGVPVQGPLFRSDDRAPSFPRVMAPVSHILHKYGVRMLRSLDDWLILVSSELACLQSKDRLLTVCTELGIQVNLMKSSLVPTRSLVYLGMEIWSLPFIARPSPVRVGDPLRLLEEFLSILSPPAFLWRRLLGLLSSLTLLVPGEMLRMRLLQICLKDQWDFLYAQFQVSWSPPYRVGLLWWARVAQQREGGGLFRFQTSAFFSDASDVGWGGPSGRKPCLGPLISSSDRSLLQHESC